MNTIKTIQRVGIVAGLFLGLSFVAGIIFLVLNILKKLAKPICFAAVTAPSLSFISTIMLVAALIILDGQLLAGMSMGSTATMGIVSLVLAFLATVAYSVAAAFIIKRALVASQINPNSTANSLPVKRLSMMVARNQKRRNLMLRFPDKEFTAVPISTRRFTFTINLFLEFNSLSYSMCLF